MKIKLLINSLKSIQDKHPVNKDFIFALWLLKNMPVKGIQDLKTAAKTFKSNIFWQPAFAEMDPSPILQLLSNIDPENFDFLAEVIFENFCIEENNLTGAFFTPKHIANLIVADVKISSKKILDPACGAGVFLKAVLDTLPARPEERIACLSNQLFGVDLNPQAIELSKFLLSLKCFEGQTEISETIPDLSHNFKTGNTLISPENFIGHEKLKPFSWQEEFLNPLNISGFDYIFSNPPFGLSRNEQISAQENKILQNLYGHIFPGKLNKYLLFCYRAYSLLNDQGAAYIITPNAWLGIKQAKIFREFLIRHQALAEVWNFEYKMFPGLEVETIICKLQKRFLPETKIKTFNQNNEGKIVNNLKHESLKNLPDLIIPPNWQEGFNSLLMHFQEVSEKLTAVFEPAIAPQIYATGKGSPRQTKEDVKNHIFHSTTKKDKDHIPYLEGKDVAAFDINWSGQYLKYGAHVAEFQNPEKFKTPRILLREILGKRPYLFQAVFTKEHYLYNRSVLHIFTKEQEDLMALCNILNSRAASFLLFIRGRKAQRKLFPKIVLDDLKDFLVSRQREPQGLLSDRKEIDELAYKQYLLSEKQIKLIEKTLS